MSRGRRWIGAAASAVVVIGVFAPAASAGGDVVWRKLYREDANATFELFHGDCDRERTTIEASFHQDFFQDSPAPPPRNIAFGLAISEFDCGDQFLARYEGFEPTSRRFDITPGLDTAKVHTTMRTCQTFPAAGDCFPVHITIFFKGVGPIDVDKEETHVHEPDCIIEFVSVYKTRAAKVWGSVSFTPPGGPPTTYALSPEALAAAGASLSSGSERSFMKGDGYECTER